MHERHELDCKVVLETPLELDADIAAVVFRAVRELLLNVVKHAEVEQASIRARGSATEICVEISDHGKGFDTTSVNELPGHKEGFGLFSIRERLKPLGADLNIESWPGRGTTAVLRAPACGENVRH